MKYKTGQLWRKREEWYIEGLDSEDQDRAFTHAFMLIIGVARISSNQPPHDGYKILYIEWPDAEDPFSLKTYHDGVAYVEPSDSAVARCDELRDFEMYDELELIQTGIGHGSYAQPGTVL